MVLFNLLQSQAAWFACVLSAAAGRPWYGTVVALLLTVVHIRRSAAPRLDFALVLAAGVVGAIADSALSQAGLLVFASGALLPGFAPHWMVALWMNFATVLNGALRPLKTRLTLAAAIGVVGGPLAYYGGVKLGALQFTASGASIAGIAIAWGLAMPFLCSLAAHMDRSGIFRAVRATALAAMLVVGMGSPQPLQAQVDRPARQWSFKVLLDEREIGWHVFRLTERAGTQEIDSEARFEVKALFVRLYRYAHYDREIWRDGCLVSIDARTDDNGDHKSVRGSRSAGAFRVERGGGSAELSKCVKTFAYWETGFLHEKKLLNSQTGLYEDVQIESRGTETIEVLGKRREASRHSIRAAGYSIDVWYSRQGEWLKLQSVTPGGRTLEYRLESPQT